MNKKNNKISNGVKNIIFKTFKFISSRFVYLSIGIFLAVSITCVYAAWNDAKTGSSGQLGQSNWNALVNEVHSKCGSNCDAAATGATTANNILTENNWNSLADLLNNTLTNCTNNNGGKCFVNEASKSALDTNLVAGNIKSGINVFGIAGSYSGPAYADCTADNGGTCYLSQASKSALDADLAAGNIKSGVNVFGVAGTLPAVCSSAGQCASGYCVDGFCCNSACTGQTCQTCGTYSSAGAGNCGYVNSSSVDPRDQCPGALGACVDTKCSGSGYSCLNVAAGSQLTGCTGCGYCNGAGSCKYCNWVEVGFGYMSPTGITERCTWAYQGHYGAPYAQTPINCSAGFGGLVSSGVPHGNIYYCACQ